MDRSNQHPYTISPSPHNLDGVHNGLYPSQFDTFYQGAPSNGLDPAWGINTSNHNVPSPQPMPNYGGDWSQSAALQTDAFRRPNSKSPAATATVASQGTSFVQYPNIHPFNNTSVYDPALTSQSGVADYLSANAPLYQQRPSPGYTVAPNALENPSSAQNPTAQRQFVPQAPVDQKALIAAIPPGLVSGPFSVIDHEKLVKAAPSKRVNNFVNIGQQDFEFAINKAVVPNNPVRKSRNELRVLAASDPKLLAKLGKKIGKKSSKSSQIKKDVRPQVLAKSNQALAGDASSSESDSSEFDSDDDFVEPSPLPQKRSEDDPRLAVRYDAIKALWRPRKKVLSTADIRIGLKDFWEVIRTIRDRWKTDTSAVKAAEEKGQKGELPLLKSRVRDQRDMAESAFEAAREHGHREILELSSENVSFLFLCYQFLQDRYTQDDVNGPFAHTILGIISMCATLTEEKLSKTYLAKVLPKLAKKGNSEIKGYVKKIETAATEGTKRATEEDKDKKAAVLPAKLSPSKANAELVAGTKRPAPTGTAASQPAKRVASSVPLSDPGSGATKLATATKRAVPATTTSKTQAAPASGAVATKTKATVSKPSNFFNVMQNTAKKPTTAAKPAAASVVATALKAAEKKPASSVVAEIASKAGFSFASTMANITKPEEKAPAPKPAEVVTAETPEQKQRRLRKEARRGLRVTFRPDSSLEEIRFFTHDPDEELGHSASMTRDVSDVGSEGRMFKQHKDVMDVDEDDDGLGEEDLKPFKEPSTVNFDEVDAEERDRNFAPYGGGVQTPDSPEKLARAQYEASTLMVFYTNPADVPSNPKDPSEDADESLSTTLKQFGTPQEETLQRAATVGVSSAAHAVPQQISAAPDIASILSALQPQSQVAPAQPSSQSADLAALIASFQPQPQPQQAPPQAAQHNPTADLSSILAGLRPQQQPQQQSQQQPQSQPQPQAPAPNPQAATDFAALFAAMSQGQSTAQAPPPNPAAFPFGFPAMPPFPFPMPPMPDQNSQQLSQQNNYPFENEERRRMRDAQDQEQDGSKNQGAKRKGWTDKKFTQPCKYWSIGRCQKGDKCTYLHV